MHAFFEGMCYIHKMFFFYMRQISWDDERQVAGSHVCLCSAANGGTLLIGFLDVHGLDLLLKEPWCLPILMQMQPNASNDTWWWCTQQIAWSWLVPPAPFCLRGSQSGTDGSRGCCRVGRPTWKAPALSTGACCLCGREGATCPLSALRAQRTGGGSCSSGYARARPPPACRLHPDDPTKLESLSDLE